MSGAIQVIVAPSDTSGFFEVRLIGPGGVMVVCSGSPGTVEARAAAFAETLGLTVVLDL